MPVPAGPPRLTTPTLGIGQQVERDALLGAAAGDPEELAVGRDQVDALVGAEAGEGALAAGGQHQTGVDRQVAYLLEIVGGVEAAHARRGRRRVVLGDLELDHAGPGRVDGLAAAVVLGGDAGDGGVQPQRQVLADEDDVHAVGGEVRGDGEDAGVVGVAAQPSRQGGQVAVVHLDAQGAAGVVDRDGFGELAVLDAKFLEALQHVAGGPAELRVMTLGLQFADHRQRQHQVVLLEGAQRGRVGEQDAGVEHVRGGWRYEKQRRSRVAFWSWSRGQDVSALPLKAAAARVQGDLLEGDLPVCPPPTTLRP